MTDEQKRLHEQFKGYCEKLSYGFSTKFKDIEVKVKDDGKGMIFYLYTVEHLYAFNMHGDYLGGGITTRKSLPGEEWNRGSDLRDGKNTYETFLKIVGDILYHETLELVVKKKREQECSEECKA